MRPYLWSLTAALAYFVIRQRASVRIDLRLVVILIGLTALVAFRRRISWAVARDERLALLAALVLPCYAALQLLPLPPSLLSFLSPERARLLGNLTAFGFPGNYAPVASVPAAGFGYLLLVSGCSLLFLAVWIITRQSDRSRAWDPVIPLLVIASGEACLGLSQYSNGTPVLGTYLNKNHFAGLLEMVFPLAAAYGMCRLGGALSGRERPGPAWAEACAGWFAAALCFAGLLLGMSKAGIISAFAGLLALGSVAAWTSFRDWRRWPAVLGVFVCCLLGFIFVPPDQLMKSVGQAFGKDMETLEGRRPIWSDSMGLVRDYPFTGVGLGGYGSVFPKYQTAVVEAEFTYAHNDYLQVVAELGMPGALVVFLLMAGVLIHGLRCAGSPDPEIRFPAIGCAGAMAAIGVHSLADFNLYIPPNALVLAWITGMAAGLPLITRRDRKRSHGTAWWVAPPAAALGLLAVTACTWTLVTAANAPPASAAGAQQQQPPPPPPALLESLRGDPASPELWSNLGQSFFRQGQRDKAMQSFAISEAQGPYVPGLLLRAARANFELGDRKAALHRLRKILEKTAAYDVSVFHACRLYKVPAEEVLSEAIPGPRAGKSYLRHLAELDSAADAARVWQHLSANGSADDLLARDYSRYLFKTGRFEQAAQALGRYLGAAGSGFQQSTWILNGGFEDRLLGTDFDWRIDSMKGALSGIDPAVSHSGSHSVRVRFDGTGNMDFQHIRQLLFLPAGNYRLSAWIKTDGITTDQGVGLLLTGVDNGPPLRAATERLSGTNGWKKLEATFQVPAGGKLAALQLVRERSYRLVNQISGTAWLDTCLITRL